MKDRFVYARLLNSLVSLAPIFLLHTIIVYYKDPNLQGLELVYNMARLLLNSLVSLVPIFLLRTVIVYYKDPNLQSLELVYTMYE